MSAPPESRESLWRLAISPTIWMAHFTLSYATAAVWCEKFAGPSAALGPARTAIALYTVAALAGIAYNGWDGRRRSRFGSGRLSLGFDTDEDRHRFLGFATLLLAALSAGATLYVAGAALAFGECR